MRIDATYQEKRFQQSISEHSRQTYLGTLTQYFEAFNCFYFSNIFNLSTVN